MEVGVAGLDRLAGVSSDTTKPVKKIYQTSRQRRRGSRRSSTDRYCGATGRWRAGWGPRPSSNEPWPDSPSLPCRTSLLKDEKDRGEKQGP